MLELLVTQDQFREANGDWSIVAMLLATVGITSSVIVFLYRTRDIERAAEIIDLKARFKLLEAKSDRCEDDRVILHQQIGAMQREIELIKDRK